MYRIQTFFGFLYFFYIYKAPYTVLEKTGKNLITKYLIPRNISLSLLLSTFLREPAKDKGRCSAPDTQ